jgi:hypothetical protein
MNFSSLGHKFKLKFLNIAKFQINQVSLCMCIAMSDLHLLGHLVSSLSNL